MRMGAGDYCTAFICIMEHLKMELTAIDIFSGAGGLSSGLLDSGINVLASVELNRDACDTYRSFHPNADVYQSDIRLLDFKRFQGVDLLVGGPPCQPFSSGGKRLAQSDGRDMLPEYIRCLSEIRPGMFLMENVPGLLSKTRRSYFSWVVDSFTSLGYVVSFKVLNAAEFGVPQTRRRLFIVGTKNNAPFQFPEPTHGVGLKQFVSSGSVISKKVVGEPNPSTVVYAKNPDLRPSPYHGHLFNGGGRAIDLSLPCHTILASAGGNKTHFVGTFDDVPRYHSHLLSGGRPGKGVFKGGRRLTVKESALLQTFPAGFNFKGSRSSQYSQIGNAVPPTLAKVLGKAIVRSFQLS